MAADAQIKEDEDFNEDYVENESMPGKEEEMPDDEPFNPEAEQYEDEIPKTYSDEDMLDLSSSVPETVEAEKPEPKKEQDRPYSRLGGPLFISVPKYQNVGKKISTMKRKISALKGGLSDIKDLRNRSTKVLSDVLDDLEVVEENIREINDVLKVKS
ncbi:MAG: hypothetical protein KAR87_05680 [Candidatus Aenigmarchaeota archaeon]|nr:hypothetical protein [Candidatus Aenigmarchaeota archaeon]